MLIAIYGIDWTERSSIKISFIWINYVNETGGADVDAEKFDDFQVLTYEDEEGDWLMVGDVPWE